MAILKNLLVSGGASRFIGTSYFQDVSIAGSATLSSLSLSGNFTVNGTATFNNTVYLTKTQDLSGTADQKPALIIGPTTGYHLEFDPDEIHAKKNATTVADLYLNYNGGKVYLSGSSVYASGSTFISPTANISTLNATNVNVTNNLRANHYDLQTVAQLGGSFYVSPTVKFPNSGTTLKVEKSGSTLTLTITDSSITSATMAGVVWTAGSGVKVSGTINGVVTGTMDGTVSSINTSSHVLTLSVSGENSANVVAGTYTASQFINLSVMLYTRKQDGTNKMINTASGAIASFTDGGNNVPVKQLVVDIDPVQDLHGYDSPWAGGAGKNKFKMRSVSQSSNGITVTANSDGTVSLSGTATANAQITMYDNADILTSLIAEGGTFTMSLNKGTYNGNTLNVSISYKETASGSAKYIIPNNPVTIPQGSIFNTANLWVPSGSTVQTLTHFSIQLEKGSSATTFAPYENICPISGITSAVVTRTGKNLLDTFGRTFNASSETANTIRTEGSTATFQGDSIVTVTNGLWSKLRFRVDGLIKGKTYTLSAFIKNPSKNNVGVAVFDGTSWARNNISQFDGTTVPVTFTYDDSFSVLIAAVITNNKGSATNATVTVSNVQLELSSTATTYEPYVGNTYTIDLNGTRYGGNLDVTTGVLTVDKVYEQFTSAVLYGNYGADSKPLYYVERTASEIKPYWYSSQTVTLISNYFTKNSTTSYTTMKDGEMRTNASTNPARFYFRWDSKDLTGINSAFASTPFQTVAELASPITVQLTAQQLSTLLGQNNIWSNTGDTNVIYESSQVDSTSNYNVGIWMNCYDQANSSSTIRVYNGSSRWPNVFLGNMTNADLPRVNGNAPYGYGLYSDNVFLRGIISATGGLIGNWTIGTTGMYYNSDAPSSTSITMIPGGTAASTTSIGGSSGSKRWIFTGKNLFGIDTDGKLYASSAEISGKITANTGSIGGIHISNSALYSGSKNAYNSNNQGFYFGSDGKFAIGKNNTQYIKWDGSSLSMNVNSISIGGDNVATAITNAEKVATNYLYYDTTNGLVVHQHNSEISSVSDLTGNVGNVRITGNGMDIYRGQTKTASYGSEVVIGPSILSSESPSNIKINTNGFQYNNGGDEAFYVGVEQRVTEISEEEDENETAPSDDDIIDRQTYDYIRICELEKKDTDEGGYMYNFDGQWIVYDSFKVFQRSTKNPKCDVLLAYYIDNYIVWALPQNENEIKLDLCSDSKIKTIDDITYYETYEFAVPNSVNKNNLIAENGYLYGLHENGRDSTYTYYKGYTSIFRDRIVNSITGEVYPWSILSAQSETTVVNEEDFIDEVHAVGGAIYYKIYVVPENVIVKSVIRTSDGSLLLPDEEWYLDENRGLWVIDDYHVKYTIAYVGDTESPYFVFGPNTYSSGEPAGKYSFATGDHCSAKGSNQAVFGRYNQRSSYPAFIIGNGTEEVRSNCFTIDWHGNVMANGQLFSNDELTSEDIDKCFI